MYRIELKSPYIEEKSPAVFNVNFNGSGNEPADIIKIIRFISDDCQELKEILKKNPSAHLTHESLHKLINEYNTWIENNQSRLLKEYHSNDKRASRLLIKYLMLLVYNRSILEPDKLNQYEPFSPEVYGETSFDLIDSLLDRVELNESDVFMDLGSGVGNVVLHVAAAAKIKCCYGFEKAEWPALYAKKMEKEFKFWMNFFGRTYSKFKLYEADFFSDEQHVNRYSPLTDTDSENTITMNDYVKETINEANLIFVNNYAFGAEVDHQLKLRFCNMLENSLIVSSKPFCSLNFRINSRNLNDIGTILKIDEEPLNGKVSWTDRPINYYFHKIDRTLLEKYFERLNNPSKTKDDDYHANSIEPTKHRKSTSSLIISTSSGSTESSPTSSPSSSNSSLNSSRSTGHLKNKTAKTLSLTGRKSTDSKSITITKKKNKKRKKTDRSHSPPVHKAKLLKKTEINIKKMNIAVVSRSKSLDKNVLNTLNIMHREVVKSNKESLMEEFSAVADAALSAQFNVNALTTLKDENLDNKLLKDCKISPKLMKTYKKIETENANHRSHSMSRLMNKTESNKNGKKSLKFKNNGLSVEEEVHSRQELGVKIMNAVDSYLKKMQKQYVKHLMYLKSTEYEEKIKSELKTELQRKKELTARKDKFEKLSTSLLKSNTDLLKKRAEELGIKNLESPAQLIEYARKMLTDNKQLNKKIDIVQKKVDDLNIKHKQPQQVNNNNNNNFIEDSSSRLKNLDHLLKKIDSKYSHPSSSSKKKSKATSIQNSEGMNNNEETSLDAMDETLSATEKNDDDEPNMAELDEEIKTIESKNHTPKKQGSNNAMETSYTKLLSPKLMSNSVVSSVQNNKYDQLLNGDRNLDGWRSFKIPKQHKVISDEMKTQTPISSPTLSTSSSNSSNRPLDDNNTQSIPRQISNDSNSSSSNSLNSSTKTDVNVTSINNINLNNINSNSNDKTYYHPKKKQFRQYMMENSNSNSINTSDQNPYSINNFNNQNQKKA